MVNYFTTGMIADALQPLLLQSQNSHSMQVSGKSGMNRTEDLPICYSVLLKRNCEIFYKNLIAYV